MSTVENDPLLGGFPLWWGMHPRFVAAIDSLHAAYEALLAGEALGPKDTKPREGVYLFCEAGRPLYVGRSNKIPNRYRGHCSDGATHHSAAFAMLLARETTGKKASYKSGPDNRKHLMANAEFKAAFEAAKTRIKAMEFRAVSEPDQTRQTLLEVYCAIVLQTPYNDFGTH